MYKLKKYLIMSIRNMITIIKDYLIVIGFICIVAIIRFEILFSHWPKDATITFASETRELFSILIFLIPFSIVTLYHIAKAAMSGKASFIGYVALGAALCIMIMSMPTLIIKLTVFLIILILGKVIEYFATLDGSLNKLYKELYGETVVIKKEYPFRLAVKATSVRKGKE